MRLLNTALANACPRLVDPSLVLEWRALQGCRSAWARLWRPSARPRALAVLLVILLCSQAGSTVWAARHAMIAWAAVSIALAPASAAVGMRLFLGRSPRHSISVAAVIVRRNPAGPEVLLIRRRDNGLWQPPGGVLERDETVTESLIREVREETGVVVLPARLTGIYRHVDTRVLSLVYLCDAAGGRVRDRTPETTGCRWVPFREALHQVDPAFRARVLDALQALEGSGNGGRLRDHSGATTLALAEFSSSLRVVETSAGTNAVTIAP